MNTTRVVIMGAAGRDFHDFNTVFRDDDSCEVVAFTRTESQNLGELDEPPERRYPAELAGEGYPDGIPIRPEFDLETIVDEADVDTVVFSYSDVSHEHVMHQASRALAAGADFRLVGPDRMMLDADVPVVAVDAVRTGCGKSQTARKFADLLAYRGADVVVVREPMPYGDLVAQKVQRFASLDDLDDQQVTIEEREEYEGHIERGHVVYAGVDYAAILDRAEAEADVIVWDGGNNELPFYTPDVHVVVADPHRAGDELRYHPGETNLRIADYVLINKENTADAAGIREVEENARAVNPDATIIHADSTITADGSAIAGKRVLVVEDGPTLTHGNAPHGAGLLAARKYGAADIVDPEPVAVGSLQRVFEAYDHLDTVLPAMGYSDRQIRDLEATIRNADPEVVVSGTPHDLARLIDVDVPVVRVRYELAEKNFTLDDVLDRHADQLGLTPSA
ncbi:cyclic 2,3-diphosphoglycerate synthase [Haloplanus aerogenes]|uniref:GTPase n=1 Tax=Haloplanus aerogenes TaxID=660522 RepID=A0A3M0CTF5_9EURY|nr:GTPase [Haloplanus aerogenes]AZH26556.1 GTPase [Haloplanus aerogenes]RMB12784.1 putative GTPase [Haloplanus aerogenes]